MTTYVYSADDTYFYSHEPEDAAGDFIGDESFTIYRGEAVDVTLKDLLPDHLTSISEKMMDEHYCLFDDAPDYDPFPNNFDEAEFEEKLFEFLSAYWVKPKHQKIINVVGLTMRWEGEELVEVKS